MKKEQMILQKFPMEIGMLVAKNVLPEGPADPKIRQGGILLEVNGESLTQFTRMDEAMDSYKAKAEHAYPP